MRLSSMFRLGERGRNDLVDINGSGGFLENEQGRRNGRGGVTAAGIDDLA